VSSDPTVAGSSVQFLSVNATVPVVIVKDPRTRKQKKSGWYRFAVCFDTSEKACEVLRFTLNMMRAEDHIAIICVKELRIDMNQVEKQVTKICHEFGRNNFETVLLETEGQERVYQAIKRYLIEESRVDNYVDFVAVGNVGINFSSDRTEKYLGSTASAVLKAKRMNVIFLP
jgi:hypothetical protein